MRVAFQPKGPRPLFQAVSADHFPPFLFEFDPHGHKLGPKIDLMPEIDPIHYSGVIGGEFCEDTAKHYYDFDFSGPAGAFEQTDHGQSLAFQPRLVHADSPNNNSKHSWHSCL